MVVFFDGNYTNEKNVVLTVNDRSFRYGDGVFETLYIRDKKAPLLPQHIERLQESMELIYVKPEIEISAFAIEEILAQLISENQIQGKCTARIIIWRKEGGLYAPENIEGHVHISVKEAILKKKEIEHLGLSTSLINYPTLISHIKSNSALQYVIMGIEMKKNDWDEIVLLDHKGQVSECLHGNIWWVKKSKIYTPPLTTGCINGASRRYLMSKLGTIVEKSVTPEELAQADHIFFSNALGLRHVRFYNHKSFAPYEQINELNWS